MLMYTILFKMGNACGKKDIQRKFGKKYQKGLYKKAKEWFDKITASTPDIGKSIFSFNYAFASAYIAWYKAARELHMSDTNIQWLLWLMNEKIITLIPKPFRKVYGKKYLSDFRKKAPQHEEKCRSGQVHPYDYIIQFHPDSDTHFGIDITRCGMRTLAADFDAMGIFPTVCRVDYMIGHYLHSGFERTKTLGDGDDCCNCSYSIGGQCEWNYEMSFLNRK